MGKALNKANSDLYWVKSYFCLKQGIGLEWGRLSFINLTKAFPSPFGYCLSIQKNPKPATKNYLATGFTKCMTVYP